MAGLSLEESYEKNGIDTNNFGREARNPTFYQAEKIAEGDFLDPENLARLSEEGLEDLAKSLARTEETYGNHISWFDEFFDQGDAGMRKAERQIDKRADQLENEMVAGIVKDKYVTGATPGDEMHDLLEQEVGEYLNGAREAIEAAVELQAKLDTVSADIAERGAEALVEHKAFIDGLGENGKDLLREKIDAVFEESGATMDAELEGLLDEHVPSMPEAAHEEASITPALALQNPTA